MSPDVTWDERIVTASPDSWCYLARDQVRSAGVSRGLSQSPVDCAQIFVDVSLLPRERLRAWIAGPYVPQASIIPPEVVLELKGERSWYGAMPGLLVHAMQVYE